MSLLSCWDSSFIDDKKLKLELLFSHKPKFGYKESGKIKHYDKFFPEFGVFLTKDSTKKELSDFIEQCNTKQFAEIQKFFDTMPRLTHTVKVKNPKTKVESDVTLTGLNDFFA